MNDLQLFERVKKVRDHYNETQLSMSKRLKVSKPTVENMTKKPNYNTGSFILIKMLEEYTEINPAWLIAGEGEMFRPKNKDENISEEKIKYEPISKYTMHLEDEIRWLRKIIEENLKVDIDEINNKNK